MWDNRCKIAVSGVGFSKVSRMADIPLAAHALEAVKGAVADSGLEMADIDGLATYPELPATGHAEVDGISIVSVNCMMAMLKLPNLTWHIQVGTTNIGGAVQQAVNALLAGVALLHGSRVGRKNPQPHLRSSDADGARASQLQHPVQGMNGDADLGRPTLILSRANPPSRARSPVTDDLLVAPDGGLNAAPFVVAGHLLPPDPAFLGNALEMAVALGWLTRRRCTGYRRRTRRHDDRGLRLVVRHSTIDAILVVGAIAGERRDGPGHLTKQRADLRGVIHIVRRQIGRDDLARLGIQADMQLPPGAAGLGAVLLDQPLAGATELQSRAVHQQMHRFSTTAGPRSGHLQCLASPAQGGVVRHREIKTEKADERADQTFGLAQREVEHRPERQRRQNGQRRIPWLAAPVRPRLGPPGGNRLLAEPHRQIATLAQACLVGWPIRQPTLLLRDMVATLGVGLERHGGHPGSGLGAAFYPTQPRRQTSDPCTNAKQVTNMRFNHRAVCLGRVITLTRLQREAANF
jgi:hypothetical protein